MSTLQLKVAPQSGVEVPAGAGPFFIEAVYARQIEGRPSPGVADLPNTIQETLRLALDDRLSGSFALPDVVPALPIELRFLGPNGAARVVRSAAPGDDAEQLTLELNKGEVATITAPDPQPEPSTPRLERNAYFLPVSDVRVPFEASTVQVAPITAGNGGWMRLGLDQIFHADAPATSSVLFPVAGWAGLGRLGLTPVHLAVDGQFAFTVEQGAGDAWLWWLTGPLPAIGVVLDDLGVVRVVRTAVALPPFDNTEPASQAPAQVPRDVTESELVANPDIYTEDPGEFCKPFKNPERVLGERSFYVVLRAEQPAISAQASAMVDPLPALGYEATAGTMSSGAAPSVDKAGAPPIGAAVSDSAGVSFLRHGLPSAYIDMLLRFERGRADLDATHPIQWESDNSRYQAATVARGHILEYRTRWRSNGYSLGTVASRPGAPGDMAPF